MSSADLEVDNSGVSDRELTDLLQKMLDADEDITARAVARRHPRVRHASSITRSSSRMRIVTEYQEKQRLYREWQARGPKRSRDDLTSQLAQKDSQIAQLQRQVDALRLSHLAMVRMVGGMGGTSKLMQLYEGYRELTSQLDDLGVLPKAEVKLFGRTNVPNS